MSRWAWAAALVIGCGVGGCAGNVAVEEREEKTVEDPCAPPTGYIGSLDALQRAKCAMEGRPDAVLVLLRNEKANHSVTKEGLSAWRLVYVDPAEPGTLLHVEVSWDDGVLMWTEPAKGPPCADAIEPFDSEVIVPAGIQALPSEIQQAANVAVHVSKTAESCLSLFDHHGRTVMKAGLLGEPATAHFVFFGDDDEVVSICPCMSSNPEECGCSF